MVALVGQEPWTARKIIELETLTFLGARDRGTLIVMRGNITGEASAR
jgi:hypothetical protein